LSYLLDTCVLSEFAKSAPDERVTEWMVKQDERDLYISVITLGEIGRGIAHLPEGTKRRRLDAWLHTEVRSRFRSRIIDVTDAISLEWGERSGALLREGRTISVTDGLIAATAVVHSLVAVTRNTQDLAPTGAPVFNPWTD
jgi:predicted nucleic acid-binding protein